MTDIRVVYILNATDCLGGATKAVMNLLDGTNNIIPHFILPEDSGIAQVLRQKGFSYSVLNYRLAVYPPMANGKDLILFLPRLLGRIFLNRRAARQVAAIANEFRADIIHTNTSVNSIGYLASRIAHLPHVWHIREYSTLYYHYYHYPSTAHFIQRLKAEQSYSICITKDIQQYNKLNDWPNSRVIYDGVLRANQTCMHLPKENYFLFAGRLEDGKGIEDLLHAYAEYTTRTSAPIPLWIAGDTVDADYKQKLVSIVEQSHNTSNVRFMGMQTDILPLMQDTTALIVPSKAEGFGFITAEGMFSGALVIGKNVLGTKEQFDNGNSYTKQDIALKYLSQEELVEHLLHVTQQGIEPYLPMVKAGQSVAKQLYSVESNQDAIYMFYCDILNRTKK